MADAFTIRQAQAADAEALADFAARLFRATYNDDTAAADLDAYISESFGRERQEAEIADPAGATFLAVADQAILGYAHAIAGRDNLARLSRIYIEAGWRGSGLANALLDAVIENARGRGATRLELTVFERNLRAMAFYRRVGFVPTGRTTFMVGEDAQIDVVMELSLAGS